MQGSNHKGMVLSCVWLLFFMAFSMVWHRVVGQARSVFAIACTVLL